MRLRLVTLQAILLISCITPPRPGHERRDPAGEYRLWLVMVFMNADSGGDPHEWILMDDLELMESAPVPRSIHLVTQVSRCGYDPYDGAWTGTRRYYVDGLGPDDPVAFGAIRLEDPPGPTDPSDGRALAGFAEWASARYPATHRMLVIEAHGSGWRGLSPCDIEDDPSCLITIPGGELSDAISLASRDRPLDLVVLNACLMGMWETGWALAPHVRHAVTSEEIGGPILGSWHDLLPRLALGPDDPRQVCAAIPDMLAGERTRANSATRTCIDLEGHDELTRAVDGLARAASDPAAAAALGRALGASLHFNKPAHHDLGDIASAIAADERASADLHSAAREVLEALDGYVVHHASSPYEGIGRSHGVCGGPDDWGSCDASTGVAIWAPVRPPPHLWAAYLEGPWSSTLWDEALGALATR